MHLSIQKKSLILLLIIILSVIVFLILRREGTKVFQENNLGWEIIYPANIKVASNPAGQRVVGHETVGDAVDFWQDGPTQIEGTEFHDGLLITMFVVKKDPNIALEDFASEKSKSGVGKPISYPVSEIEVNGIKGYQSLVQGFGKTLYVFLPFKNTDDKVLMMYIFAEGKYKSSYDAEYKKMLKTFRFL